MTTDPVTISSDASAAEALARMDEHRVRHLPVVDDGRLSGVLSDRDVLSAPDSHVRDVMTKRVMSVAPDETAVAISVELGTNRISCLPVVEAGKLVGIVTEFDLLRLFLHACNDGSLSGDIDPPISQLMSNRVVGLKATDRLIDAESVIATIGVRHAPVISDGKLVGIISDRDLRRARGEGTSPHTAVADFMTKNVKTLSPSDPLSAAAKLMVEFKFSALPIVDGEVAGIVSTTDIVDHCLETLRG